MKLMDAHHVRHLPVLKEDTIVGVMSMRDLVNAIISDQATTIEHLEDYISGEGHRDRK